MLPMLAREKNGFPLFGLRNGIDRLFDDFFANGLETVGTRVTGPTAFVPAIDVKETETNLVIEVEVPGLKPNEVNVTVEDGTLVLRGERKQEKEEKTKQWHRSERYWGKFERWIPLPEYADLEKVDATCKDGVLLLAIPKKAGAKSRAISVRVK